MITEPAKRPLTIRHCLTNTTGLMNPQAMPSMYRQRLRDELASLGYEGRRRFSIPTYLIGTEFARWPSCH